MRFTTASLALMAFVAVSARVVPSYNIEARAIVQSSPAETAAKAGGAAAAAAAAAGAAKKGAAAAAQKGAAAAQKGAAAAGAAKKGAAAAKKGAAAAKGAGAAAAKKAGAAAKKGAKKGKAGKKAKGAAAAGAAGAGAGAGAAAAAGAGGDNSAADAAAATDSAAAATATSDDSNAAASSTDSAASATRTRACDPGDQSLAAGLNAAVVIGLGLQASVVTLQGTNNSADFTDGATRLSQFLSTMDLQIQMAQNIADDDSFAQKQLGLLASAQKDQTAAVAGLTGDAVTDADALTSLLQSFLDTTNNAQDGASNALIDCFLPLTTVSG